MKQMIEQNFDYYSRALTYYEEYTPISENKAGIELATLGNDAGIYGAARLILD